MPAFYKIDKEHRLVLTTGSETLSWADIEAHQQSLQKDPDFDPEYSQIADFSHVTSFDLSGEDIRALARRSVFSSHAHRAVIAPSDLGFGLARMFEMLRENDGEMGIRVFRTLEEALEWVFSRSTNA